MFCMVCYFTALYQGTILIYEISYNDCEMMTFLRQRTWFISIFVAGIMVLTPLVSLGDDIVEVPSGFDGVSWRRVVPLNKATMVQFDTMTQT